MPRTIEQPIDPYANDAAWLPEYRPEDHDKWVVYWEARNASRERQTATYIAAHERAGTWTGIKFGIFALGLIGILKFSGLMDVPSVDCTGSRSYSTSPQPGLDLRELVDRQVIGVTNENVDEVVQFVADKNNLTPNDSLQDWSDFPIVLPDYCT